jgi:hypothetical protein
MDALDSFARIFSPARTASRIPLSVARRHADVLHRCAGIRDSVTVVASCFRPNEPLGYGTPRNVLMLTDQRLVIKVESPIVRRLRLHLNAELHQLTDVMWTDEPRRRAVQLALTAIDGATEQIWIRAADDAHLAQLHAAFRRAWPVPPRKKAAKAAKAPVEIISPTATARLAVAA